MSKVVSAISRELPFGQNLRRIEVTFDLPARNFVYEAQVVPSGDTAYMGIDGECVRVLFDSGGHSGFNLQLNMVDGSSRNVCGWWTSGVLFPNEIFPSDDPIVEVVDVTENYPIVCHVRKSVLDRFDL